MHTSSILSWENNVEMGLMDYLNVTILSQGMIRMGMFLYMIFEEKETCTSRSLLKFIELPYSIFV